MKVDQRTAELIAEGKFLLSNQYFAHRQRGGFFPDSISCLIKIIFTKKLANWSPVWLWNWYWVLESFLEWYFICFRDPPLLIVNKYDQSYYKNLILYEFYDQLNGRF